MARGSRHPHQAVSLSALDDLLGDASASSSPDWMGRPYKPLLHRHANVQWHDMSERSSTIRRAGFIEISSGRGEVYIEFKRQEDSERVIYRSDDVPRDVFEGLLQADSPGRYRRDVINHDSYDGAVLKGDDIPANLAMD